MKKKYMEKADYFTENLEIEFAEDNKKAIISIPLITAGENQKHIIWERNVLNEITDMFRGVVFKYDINGTQGSSHVPEHLYSPFYDVGWTYEDIRGSWFDGNKLWVKGEITNPEVVEKLSRIGANGKRELNAASSGVLLDYDYVVCTICGKTAGTCEHKRGKEYNGKIAGIKPISKKAVRKALHVALTNDPADGEAIIKNVLLQELKEIKQKEENLNNKEKGDKKMSEEKDKVEESPKEKKEEKKQPEKVETAENKKEYEEKEEKKEKTETAANGMIVCPNCGHKFKAEKAEMERKDNMSSPKEVNSIPKENMAPKTSSNDESTNYNRQKIDKQGKIESADLLERKYKKRVVDSIKNESKRLNRNMVETADMDIKQLETIEQTLRTTPSPKKEKVKFEGQDLNGYGAPIKKEDGPKEFADMSASERSKKLGDDGALASCFADSNPRALEYLEKRKRMKGGKR